MYLFKTSGSTFRSVIENQKHAYRSRPRDWEPGELVLVSKNRTDLDPGEKQIQYTMRIEDIRELQPGEVEEYWPGTEGRWQYIVDCYDAVELGKPFDLEDVIGPRADRYRPVVTFKKLDSPDEDAVMKHLSSEPWSNGFNT